MNELDESLIEEAETAKFSAKRPIWKPLGAIAACALLVVGIASAPNLKDLFNNHELGEETLNDVEYVPKELIWDAEKGVFVYAIGTVDDLDDGEGEIGDVSWNTYPAIWYETKIAGGNINETVQETVRDSATLKLPESTYSGFSASIIHPYLSGEYESYLLKSGYYADSSDLGEYLATVPDKYSDFTHDVYAMKGVSSDYIVLVNYLVSDTTFERKYCMFVNIESINEDVKFATLSEFMNTFCMRSMLYIGETLVTHSVADNTDTLSEFYDHTELRSMIFSLDGIACTYEEFEKNCESKKSIGMNITHETFFYGKGTKGLQIFEDGYLMTNLDGTLRVFIINKEAAKAIISHVEEANYKDIMVYDEDREVLTNAPSETTNGLTDGLTQTSMGYDPHNPYVEETTTAKPPYAVETTTETAKEPISTWSDEKGGLTTPGYDPNASTNFADDTYPATTSHDILPVEPSSTIPE